MTSVDMEAVHHLPPDGFSVACRGHGNYPKGSRNACFEQKTVTSGFPQETGSDAFKPYKAF